MSEIVSSDGRTEMATTSAVDASQEPKTSPLDLSKLQSKGKDRFREAMELAAAQAESEAAPSDTAGGPPVAQTEPESATEASPAFSEPDTPEQPEQPPEASTAPFTAKDAAEQLGISPEQLYDLQLTTGDGETVTLGALKDAYQDRTSASQETADRIAEIDRREAGLASDYALSGVLAASGRLTQEEMAQAGAHLQDRAATAFQGFTQVFPDMRDDATRQVFEEDAAQMLVKYGVNPQVFPVLAAIGGTGILSLMRQAVRDAKARQPKPKTPPKPVSRDKGRAPAAGIDKAKLSGNARDRFAQIGASLRK